MRRLLLALALFSQQLAARGPASAGTVVSSSVSVGGGGGAGTGRSLSFTSSRSAGGADKGCTISTVSVNGVSHTFKECVDANGKMQRTVLDGSNPEAAAHASNLAHMMEQQAERQAAEAELTAQKLTQQMNKMADDIISSSLQGFGFAFGR